MRLVFFFSLFEGSLNSLHQEEFFGPVINLFSFVSEDESIELANRNPYLRGVKTINPTTGERLETYFYDSEASLKDSLERASAAQIEWAKLRVEERIDFFIRLRDVLDQKAASLAKTMTQEMGKPLTQSYSEIEKTKRLISYYEAHAEEALQDQLIESPFRLSFVRADPLGVVLGIMPWNFPIWQTFRFAVPTLFAGNAVLLKHAENVTGLGYLMDQVFESAGFPDYLFKSIRLPVEKIEDLVASPLLAAASLTGSSRAGKSFASLCGRYLKKTVLELGGSDPYLVFEDADLNFAVKKTLESRLINSGQSCISAKRFLIQESVLPAFRKKLLALIKTKKIGDPKLKDTDVGPLARFDLRDALHEQVLKLKKNGATIHCGGETPTTKGAFYPITVIEPCLNDQTAHQEEFFGPVINLFSFVSEDESIELANRSPYGLGAAIFTKDKSRINRLPSLLHSGSVFINDFVKSDPSLPFGGVKDSGYGRELSLLGLHEFVNMKTIVLA